jgi:chromosomal replication initiator protein
MKITNPYIIPGIKPEEIGTVEKIIEHVSNIYKIDKAKVKGESRKNKYSFPRQIAMYVIYSCTYCSFEDVGDCFNGRDHTTVLVSVDKIGGFMEFNKELEAQINKVISDLELEIIPNKRVK